MPVRYYLGTSGPPPSFLCVFCEVGQHAGSNVETMSLFRCSHQIGAPEASLETNSQIFAAWMLNPRTRVNDYRFYAHGCLVPGPFANPIPNCEMGGLPGLTKSGEPYKFSALFVPQFIVNLGLLPGLQNSSAVFSCGKVRLGYREAFCDDRVRKLW